MNWCCCKWGTATLDEWPEFECADCAIHKNEFGMADRRCKRHDAKDYLRYIDEVQRM